MSKVFNLLAVIIGFAICSSVYAQSAKVSNKDLRELKRMMGGEFSSEEQSKSDSSYFHIKLRMHQIWGDRKDGFWLYVEQATADAEDKPYRQRVYHVFIQDKSMIVSKVFEMPDSAKFVGGWKDTAKLKDLKYESLIDRQGCAIMLHKGVDGSFAGTTPGRECLSSLRGATYATSEVTIYADRLLSWDRGWDKDNKQVWGAVKGGYIFKKLRSF